jgi:hypothetical protein
VEYEWWNCQYFRPVQALAIVVEVGFPSIGTSDPGIIAVRACGLCLRGEVISEVVVDQKFSH